MGSVRKTFFVVMALVVQAICAPQVKTSRNPSTIKTPANISVEELNFIIRSRNGEFQETPKNISPCARAILGCCKENVMNGYCSETLNCGAFFFDDNPCDEKFVVDALKAAKSFYEQLNSLSK